MLQYMTFMLGLDILYSQLKNGVSVLVVNMARQVEKLSNNTYHLKKKKIMPYLACNNRQISLPEIFWFGKRCTIFVFLCTVFPLLNPIHVISSR